jgi:hypothetical protein
MLILIVIHDFIMQEMQSYNKIINERKPTKK